MPEAVSAPSWDEIEGLLAAMAAQQEGRVLSLARRLRPGLTAEDVRNAHDYTELRDADFQFEDGLLAGLLAAATAVRARRRERERVP
jgi:hypothetical protein